MFSLTFVLFIYLTPVLHSSYSCCVLVPFCVCPVFISSRFQLCLFPVLILFLFCFCLIFVSFLCPVPVWFLFTCASVSSLHHSCPTSVPFPSCHCSILLLFHLYLISHPPFSRSFLAPLPVSFCPICISFLSRLPPVLALDMAL